MFTLIKAFQLLIMGCKNFKLVRVSIFNANVNFWYNTVTKLKRAGNHAIYTTRIINISFSLRKNSLPFDGVTGRIINECVTISDWMEALTNTKVFPRFLLDV